MGSIFPNISQFKMQLLQSITAVGLFIFVYFEESHAMYYKRSLPACEMIENQNLYSHDGVLSQETETKEECGDLCRALDTAVAWKWHDENVSGYENKCVCLGSFDHKMTTTGVWSEILPCAICHDLSRLIDAIPGLEASNKALRAVGSVISFTCTKWKQSGDTEITCGDDGEWIKKEKPDCGCGMHENQNLYSYDGVFSLETETKQECAHLCRALGNAVAWKWHDENVSGYENKCVFLGSFDHKMTTTGVWSEILPCAICHDLSRLIDAIPGLEASNKALRAVGSVISFTCSKWKQSGDTEITCGDDGEWIKKEKPDCGCGMHENQNLYSYDCVFSLETETKQECAHL